MKLLFCCYDFRRENLRLMPWRYVYEIARRLPGLGLETTILTDQKNAAQPEDVTVVDGVAISPTASLRLLRTIEGLSSDVVLWPLGPRSVAFLPFLSRLPAKVVGYLPGPILRWADFRAARGAGLREWREAAEWLLACRLGWGAVMSRCCAEFVVMSHWNVQMLTAMGIPAHKIHLVTAGRDPVPASYPKVMPRPTGSQEKIGLFMGWPTRVRGIELLLDSLAIARRESPNLRLVILARGQSTPAHQALHRRVAAHPAGAQIRIIEGFLPPEEVRRHIEGCDFGVLPFLVVPADRPITFLEFFAAGKPVITTDAAGLPELVAEGRGLVSKRGSPRELAEALIGLATESGEIKEERRGACVDFIRRYPDWDACAAEFAAIIR
jgi:glycosyltransferase involved in cell wall biosynthesis